MSASLVGSEMCIRDRRGSGSERLAQLFVVCLQGGLRIQSDCGPRRLDSVSYTHLTLPTICSV
eukprot:5119877-Alexandrium_andersonii.AAC.1